jgi:histidine triad (HIT) family protein
MTTYDPQNIFARIVRGELPCTKVFEDEHTFAFMDIMPRADGHTLVVPRAASRNILDIDAGSLQRLILTVQRVARAVKLAMRADGLTIQQFNENAGGQIVFHTHVHILPRWTGVALRPHTGEMAPPESLAAHAEAIRAALDHI